MSVFSRLFRKSPPPPAAPSPASGTLPAPIEPPRAPDPLVVAAEEQTLRAAVASGDAGVIGRLVIEGSTTGIRQRAAEAVQDPEQLRQLIRGVRGGKDKNVYRILTSKRDADLAARRESQRLKSDVDAAADALERHGRRPYDALFAATLEQLEKRWQAVSGGAAADVTHRAERALELSRDVIRQHREGLERQAERERAAAQAAAEAQSQRERERAAAAATAADRARQLEAQRQAELATQQAEELALRNLGGLLRRALAALEDGSTARAARLRAQFEEALATAPPLPPWLARRRQDLDARLNELKDWKTFTVAPKRAELMQQIEALVGSTLEPALLAEQIRDLQQQWRTLGKGAEEDLSQENQRFRETANRAYEPCRIFFAAQAEARRENLARRESLLERLAAFSAAQETEGRDWRFVMQVLAEARREWRRYSPVDRAAAKPLQERFERLIGALQGRLDAEHARNVGAKRALIERAAELVVVEDTRKAIDETKELQRRWRSVGIVPRDQEEVLWDAFRLHCDAVFQRREHEAAAYVAGLEANRTKAMALCDELDRIGALVGAELLSSVRRLDELRGAFEELDLPRQGARELRAAFERASAACLAAVDAQRASDGQRLWRELLEVANQVRACALASIRKTEAAEREALRGAAESAIAGVSQWPKGARALIERQLADLDGGTVASDVAANEARLRALCVRAEVLAGIPSPPEDESLRREQQMQRLVQAMGQGLRADEAAQLDALMLDWVVVGPTEAHTYRELTERLLSCRAALVGRSEQH